ncbi:MAG: hypothetical protein KKH25_02810, partial [Candidatus Omnitrophica bacterium]|nr:hypothetical protein [Candidatus Omnitrophota bacterium]
MDNQGRYDLFLKSLRVALTNVSVYFREHPIFMKSVQDLKAKIDQLCQLTGLLTLEVAYDKLSCNGEDLASSNLIDDIRNFFHRRKVKTVKIEKGASLNDLTIFLQQVGQPPRDILLSGGLHNMLEVRKV